MGRFKKEVVEEVAEEVIDPAIKEKEEFLALYDKLKELGINRISDLENKISRL